MCFSDKRARQWNANDLASARDLGDLLVVDRIAFHFNLGVSR